MTRGHQLSSDAITPPSEFVTASHRCPRYRKAISSCWSLDITLDIIVAALLGTKYSYAAAFR